MSTSKPFSALILAGGQSSRMGQDKALLQLNGQSLLAHMQQLALAAGASEVLISRNQPGFIQDASGQFGPLAGILAALEHCTSSHLLVLPIDTPRLDATSLKLLLQKADGYVATIKSGVVTFRDGAWTGATPGGLIRGPQRVELAEAAE